MAFSVVVALALPLFSSNQGFILIGGLVPQAVEAIPKGLSHDTIWVLALPVIVAAYSVAVYGLLSLALAVTGSNRNFLFR